MRQIRISNEKAAGIVADFLRNAGLNVVSTFSHSKGVTVEVTNPDIYEEFENSLKDKEEDYD
jgi:hypothetical protein